MIVDICHDVANINSLQFCLNKSVDITYNTIVYVGVSLLLKMTLILFLFCIFRNEDTVQLITNRWCRNVGINGLLRFLK